MKKAVRICVALAFALTVMPVLAGAAEKEEAGSAVSQAVGTSREGGAKGKDIADAAHKASEAAKAKRDAERQARKAKIEAERRASKEKLDADKVKKEAEKKADKAKKEADRKAKEAKGRTEKAQTKAKEHLKGMKKGY